MCRQIIQIGNYDEDSEGNEDYDPDEDLRMMYDDEEYDEEGEGHVCDLAVGQRP